MTTDLSDLDELLGNFDIRPNILEPLSSEEHFIKAMTEGKHPKVYNLRYHIHRELVWYNFMCSKGMLPRKEIVEQGRAIYKQLSPREYAELLIEYAIDTQYSAAYAVASEHGKRPADKSKLVEMLCEEETIKNTINNTFHLR